jgi:hypothetical protein
MNVGGDAGTPVAVVPVEGVFLDRILDEEYAQGSRVLSRMAYGRFDAAQMRTAWGSSHLRRFALMSGDEVLASAKQYQLTANLRYWFGVRLHRAWLRSRRGGSGRAAAS